jgi:hypothetical protein
MAAACGMPISKKLGLERECRLMLEFFHNRGKLMYVQNYVIVSFFCAVSAAINF